MAEIKSRPQTEMATKVVVGKENHGPRNSGGGSIPSLSAGLPKR